MIQDSASREFVGRTSAADRAEAAVELPDLLLRVSREVSGLAGKVDRLQTSLSDFLMASADWVLVEEAQTLDHVRQHMSELAEVLKRAAGQARRQSIPIDPVLEGVLLSGLVRRLSGWSEDAADSGEMELL
jgi:hypothetical protein